MGTAREVEKERIKAVAVAAVEALGAGYDVTLDYRLKYCKRTLIKVQQTHKKDLSIPGGIVIPNVRKDIKCDTGERMRFTSDVMQFQQMSQLFNKSASIDGKIPLGFFNAMYDLSGSWQDDATQIKSLAFDGCFITIYCLKLASSSLVLLEEVKNDIPSNWDPERLARFIEKYGTHIVVAVGIGGKHVLYLKENQASSLSAKDVHKYMKNAGDICFTNGSGDRSSVLEKNEISYQYEIAGHAPHTQLAHAHSAHLLFGSKDVTILSRRRGGAVFSKTHTEWEESVYSHPDAISMCFVPITSLISGVPGSGFLQHAINLYLRHKPFVDDIQYFLDFQVPRQWIPVYSELPLGLSRKHSASPSLQFSLMGSKLYVNTAQVVVIKKPVTGVRLYLEGKKSNKLAIHVQHLSVLPRSLERCWSDNVSMEQPRWHGSDEVDKRWFEPVQWKSFSHVCTAPVKYSPEWSGDKGGVFVVTGAQLQVKKMYGLKNVLHLRLLFARVVRCVIKTSRWHHPAASERSTFFSSLSTKFSSKIKSGGKELPVVVDSAVFPGGPPRPVQSPKLLKFVDTSELVKGPQDNPGHWLVTAAQLELDTGKISLRVKYSLLNYL